MRKLQLIAFAAVLLLIVAASAARLALPFVVGMMIGVGAVLYLPKMFK